MIQYILAIANGSTLKAKAQSSYNNWFRVAEVADEIAANPEKAAVLIRTISGIADTARNEIKAYSNESLHFVPFRDPAYEGGPNPAPKLSLWQRFMFGFRPK